jgi:hypothetical protein
LDHYSGVPSPDDEVSRLRLLDSLKAFNARVEIRGRRIRIGEASLLINCMDQMRAVVFRIAANPGVERSGN